MRAILSKFFSRLSLQHCWRIILLSIHFYHILFFNALFQEFFLLMYFFIVLRLWESYEHKLRVISKYNVNFLTELPLTLCFSFSFFFASFHFQQQIGNYFLFYYYWGASESILKILLSFFLLFLVKEISANMFYFIRTKWFTMRD